MEILNTDLTKSLCLTILSVCMWGGVKAESSVFCGRQTMFGVENSGTECRHVI